MDGRVGGWMYGWMDGWMDGRKDRYIDDSKLEFMFFPWTLYTVFL